MFDSDSATESNPPFASLYRIALSFQIPLSRCSACGKRYTHFSPALGNLINRTHPLVLIQLSLTHKILICHSSKLLFVPPELSLDFSQSPETCPLSLQYVHPLSLCSQVMGLVYSAIVQPTSTVPLQSQHKTLLTLRYRLLPRTLHQLLLLTPRPLRSTVRIAE